MAEPKAITIVAMEMNSVKSPNINLAGSDIRKSFSA